MDQDQVKSQVIDFYNKMNAHFNVAFKIRDTHKEIFGEPGLNAARFVPATDVSQPATLAIVANNHRNAESLNRTLQHELLGHYSLNTYTKEDKHAILQSLLDNWNEPSLSTETAAISQIYADQPALVQAEELYARIAERVDLATSPTSRYGVLESSGPLTKDIIENDIKHCANEISSGLRHVQTVPTMADYLRASTDFDAVESFKNSLPTPPSEKPSTKIGL